MTAGAAVGCRTDVARAAAALASLAAAISVQAVPVPGQGTGKTTLQARDFNVDSVVDACQDTVLDLAWPADVRPARA